MPEDAEKIALEYSNPMDEGADPLRLSSMPFGDRVAAIREASEHNPEARFPSEDTEGPPKSLKELSGMRYEDLEVIIEPMSMARTDQAMMQKRVQDQFAIISGAAGIMAQTPWIDWEKLFELWGQSLNSQEFGEVLRTQALRQAQGLSQQAMEGQANAASQGGGGGGGAPGAPGGGGMGGAPDAMAAAMQGGQELAAAARANR